MEQQVKVEAEIFVNDDPSPQKDQNDPLSGKVDAKRPLRKGPKKRTKTGCLTCRKRRIKCGEEKPICSNCQKSKRECEGYARPVIFKPLVGVFANYMPSHYVNGPLQPMSTSMRVPMVARPVPESLQQRPAGSHQPFLAPRPIQLPSGGQLFYHPRDAASWGTAQLASMTPFHYPPNQMYAPVPVEVQPSVGNDSVSPSQEGPGQQRPAASRTVSQVTNTSSLSEDGLIADAQGRPHGSAHHGSWPHDSTSDLSSSTVEYRSEQRAQSSVLPHDHHPEQVSPSAQSSATLQSGSSILMQYEQVHRPSRPGLLSPVSMPQVIYMDEDSDDDDYYDYYDVDSDEEMADQTQVEDFNHLTLIMASADRDPQRLRSFTSYLNEPNILATYRPTFGSTPLNNPKTARIFVHFLHATGPSLSIFERHPSDASIGVLGAAVPSAQQGLWTYTLPLKALEHPPLLQAMLAISSLQIAALQQAPPTVSIKHYNYALRRLRKAVGLPTRRKQIGTLAAALLLGYYEVVAAEHSKWNSHLAGSTHLIREVDFAGLTRDLRAHRRRMQALREHHARQRQSPLGGHFSYLDDPASEDDPFAEKEATVDEKLIGAITGRAVNYDEFGTVETGHLPTPKKHFTRKDIENFRIQCDLHWWYCKQDMIHSMISGNRLFLPYDHWSQCTPRAGVGRLDAVYGSFDHLILLLGRVTDFGTRDRKRKISAGRAAGCDWKPSPGYFNFMKRFAGVRGAGPPPPTPAAHGSTSLSHAGLQGPGPPPRVAGGEMGSPPSSSSTNTAGRKEDSPPMMYGMIPPRGPVQLPAGFSSNGLSGADADSSPDAGSRSSSEEADHDVSYHEAELEWESILAAFNAFTAACAGRDYMALPPDLAPGISTPFGAALQYCTTTVGVLWGFYYAGRILLHRIHPSMPPAMMVAAGVAAATTAEYAQIVGKIAAGIYYPQRYNLAAGSLSPTLGSSLTEMTVPIFFAAVQYTDAAQRGWTVSTLREITRLTGWKSATTIASGCENAWVTAAQKGKGPAYQRTGAPGPRGAATEAQAQAQAQQHGNSNPGMTNSAINNNHDRRVIPVAKSHYVTWAWGILSLEDDLLNLELQDRVPNQY